MISIFVPGTPVPKGSAKAFYSKKLGRAMVVQTNADKQKPWASIISVMAREAFRYPPVACPVEVHLSFLMPRPKAHYNTKGLVKPCAPIWHQSRPDVDKLERCVLDALTGIVWVDDSQVCMVTKYKKYPASYETPGVKIIVKVAAAAAN